MQKQLLAGILALLIVLPGISDFLVHAADDGANSSQRILFVDEAFIAEKSAVELKLHPPRKTGEQLIVSEHPWENATLNWFSVLQDGGKFRMWYECYDVEGWPTADDTSLCYAESTNGIHWTKPQLGLVSYQGSTANNILFRQIGDGTYRSRVHGSCVFIDPHAPASERYKCVSQGQFQGIGDRPYYIAGMTSPDGLHWTRLPKPICLVFADSQYSGFWDESKKLYTLFGRTSGRGGRAIGRSVSEGFESFPLLSEPCVLQTESDDPLNCDLYNPACQQYPGVPGVYLMFPSVFHHREDTLDIRLSVSRDGEKWTSPNHTQRFVSLGSVGEFDSGSLYAGNGACQLHGDEMSFFYSGSPLKHEEVDLPQLSDPKNRRVISRAVAKRDRLVSVTPTKSVGHLVTTPIQFKGQRLVVNAATRPGGHVRIGLLDKDGQTIPKHGVADCQSLEGDHLNGTISWVDGESVSSLAGQDIRLRIELLNADLFSVQFQE
ncbi:MAG: hypothetical protein U0929_07335 [Planctomycetaceae bacterium]